MPLSFTVELPLWANEKYATTKSHMFLDQKEKMQFVINLAGENVKQRTGGPFGAAVFEEGTGGLVSLGVNTVVAQNTSIAHAETVAIALAQKSLQTYDLAGAQGKRFSLYSSGQPCIMCFGVIWWSGITKLVCAAQARDIEQIVGFKEGPVPDDWQEKLHNRVGLPKVEIITDILRKQACEVLELYANSGMPVYNAGSDK